MSEENIELVRFVTEEGLNKGKLEFIDDVFSADYEVHTAGLALPKGPAAFQMAVEFWKRAFPDFTCGIQDMFARRGELVGLRFRTTGTHTGPLMWMPPTGRDVRRRGRRPAPGARRQGHRVVDQRRLPADPVRARDRQGAGAARRCGPPGGRRDAGSKAS